LSATKIFHNKKKKSANLLVAHARVDEKFTRTVSNFRRKMRPFGRSLEP